MVIERISTKYEDVAWELYFRSFPLAEQRSRESHERAMQDAAFHPDIIMVEGEFRGIIYYWVWQGLCFVEHLATVAQNRGQGTGARAMRWLLGQGYLTILEIDPPEDEISIRRRGFYERLGMVYNDFDYVHPSFRPTTAPHRLMLMSYPDALTFGQFERFKEFNFQHVLTYVDR